MWVPRKELGEEIEMGDWTLIRQLIEHFLLFLRNFLKKFLKILETPWVSNSTLKTHVDTHWSISPMHFSASKGIAHSVGATKGVGWRNRDGWLNTHSSIDWTLLAFSSKFLEKNSENSWNALSFYLNAENSCRYTLLEKKSHALPCLKRHSTCLLYTSRCV